ncbi:MAG: lasso peptide biosynthesis protein, partial [Mycobacterium sp.]|nr:lasso peptide biosynthesis protein [Mycobacterium sp.]
VPTKPPFRAHAWIEADGHIVADLGALHSYSRLISVPAGRTRDRRRYGELDENEAVRPVSPAHYSHEHRGHAHGCGDCTGLVAADAGRSPRRPHCPRLPSGHRGSFAGDHVGRAADGGDLWALPIGTYW